MLLYLLFEITQKILIYLQYSKMESQISCGSRIASQTCLYCIEKDEMLKKYEKLVELLRKRAKRSNSTIMFTLNGMGSRQNSQAIRDISNQLSISRNSSYVGNFNNSVGRFQDTLLSPSKLIQWKLMETKKSRISQPSLLFASAPSGFNRIRTPQNHKKINLSTQWLQKFTELNKKLTQKQKRINLLVDQVFRLKNQYMYIRSILMNLLKNIKIQQIFKKPTVGTKVKDIISLLFHIFEYSQQELNEIFETGQNSTQNRKIVHKIDENKEIYIPKFVVNGEK